MKIDVLCTSYAHPVVPLLRHWCGSRTDHDAAFLTQVGDLRGGDILFLVSVGVLIGADIRARYRHTLVLHASDLPKGRGWSPHIWEILNGAEHITVSLLEAEDRVDTGAIWAKQRVDIPVTALHDEINARIFAAELSLMDTAVDMALAGPTPIAQTEIDATTWPRRTPADSQLDPKLPLEDLFDAIRVADPARFPAFFDLRGARYTLTLTRTEPRDEHEN